MYRRRHTALAARAFASFGFYAFDPGRENTRIRDAGSGVFISPGLGLTAAHVTRSFRALDDRFEALAKRRTALAEQYTRRDVLEPSYRELIYQTDTADKFATGGQNKIWQVTLDWPSHDTDISVLKIVPFPQYEVRDDEHTRSYFDWHLLPPPLGAQVRLFGYPQPDIHATGTDHTLDLYFEMRSARVAEHIYPIQAHGFGEFPGFRLDVRFAHGFSGGPVLWNDHLVGVFSGPDLVASLWPLALFCFRDQAEDSLATLFDSQVIDVKDWKEVRDRVVRASCSVALKQSTAGSRCSNQHVILSY